MYKVHVHCACDATAPASTTMKVTPTPLQSPRVQGNAAELTTKHSWTFRQTVFSSHQTGLGTLSRVFGTQLARIQIMWAPGGELVHQRA